MIFIQQLYMLQYVNISFRFIHVNITIYPKDNNAQSFTLPPLFQFSHLFYINI